MINLRGKIPQRKGVILMKRKELLESQIEEARDKLNELSPIYKVLDEERLEISRQITYWSNRKYDAQRKLIKVKIIPTSPPRKSSTKGNKEPTVSQMIDSLAKISEFDRSRLLEVIKTLV